VKVAGSSPPPFLQRLEDAGTIMEAHKFSKFLTGAAAFNRVQTLPWWSDHPLFEPLFQEKMTEKKGSEENGGGGSILSNGQNEAVLSDVPLGNGSSATKTIVRRSVPPSEVEPTISPTVLNKSPAPAGKSPPLQRFLSFRVETGQTQMRRSLARLSFQSSSGVKKGEKKGVRVEPKSYFANERTFIQWISASLLLVTISELLLVMHDIDGHTGPRRAGLALILCAMIVAVYALLVYYRRVHLLQGGRPYGYVDHAGPAFLTGVLLFAIIVLCVFTFQDATPLEAMVATHWRYPSSLHQMAGQCIRHNLTALPSLLEFQPSGALVDAQRKRVLVPSRNWITSLPSAAVVSGEGGAARSGIVVVAELDRDLNVDIEALAYIGDTLFALSEKSDGSEILAFEWSGDDSSLSLVRRWNLDKDAPAEGMVYVPGDSGKGKLYVAYDLLPVGGTKEKRTVIHGYDIPDVNDASVKKLHTVSKLSTPVLTQGLLDVKIASMQFFENVLYLLFDNERLIRSFDISAGTFLNEWRLPVIPGFEKEWEGMALERVYPNNNNEKKMGNKKLRFLDSTRSSLDNSVLVLHLALDSPAQIWTISLDKLDTLDGVTWTLPSCAGYP